MFDVIKCVCGDCATTASVQCYNAEDGMEKIVDLVVYANENSAAAIVLNKASAEILVNRLKKHFKLE